MSISNRHTVTPFISGESKALTGQRLAKIGYKKTEKNPNPLKSVCVSVPVIQELSESQLESLMPHIVGILENAQDGIIRKAYETDPSIMSVGDGDISVDACIAYLESEETGGRLTVEFLREWFVLSLKDKLTEFLTVQGSKNLDGAALTKAVGQTLAGYEGMLTSLSGGKTHYDAGQRKKLETILAMTDEGDEVAEKLMKRIGAMAKKDEKIAESLGLISFD